MIFSQSASALFCSTLAYKLELTLCLITAESIMHIPSWVAQTDDLPLQHGFLQASAQGLRCRLSNGHCIPLAKEGIEVLACPIGSRVFCSVTVLGCPIGRPIFLACALAVRAYFLVSGCIGGWAQQYFPAAARFSRSPPAHGASHCCNTRPSYLQVSFDQDY